jgi:hypothetical protein
MRGCMRGVHERVHLLTRTTVNSSSCPPLGSETRSFCASEVTEVPAPVQLGESSGGILPAPAANVEMVIHYSTLHYTPPHLQQMSRW